MVSETARPQVELVAGQPSKPSLSNYTAVARSVTHRDDSIAAGLWHDSCLGTRQWRFRCDPERCTFSVTSRGRAPNDPGSRSGHTFRPPTISQSFLRAVEYSLFGALTLLWVFSRYDSILLGADAGNVAELLLDGRTSMIGLFLLMVVHGIFIPHRWHETARVVLTMALAPALGACSLRGTIIPSLCRRCKD